MTKNATIIETNRTNREISTEEVLAGRGVRLQGEIRSLRFYQITDTVYEALKADGWSFKRPEAETWN